MRLQTVPARQGVVWVRQGFRIFFKRPMAFAALFATFMFAVFVLALLPIVGTLVLLAALPLVSLGFMIATRVALNGDTPTPRVYIEPLRTDRTRVKAMLWIGVSYAFATYAIMWLSDVVDGGAFESLMDALPAAQTSQEGIAVNLATPGLFFGMLIRFGLAGLLAVPYWHAPALVHWDGHGCGKALFSSTLACWRNRGAFAVYSVTWFAVILVLCMISSLVFGLLGQPQLLAAVAVPISLMFTTVFYVSLYFTFADCFAAGETELAIAA